MTFTPTPEQSAIVAEAVNTTDNLLISALAGAAKTSTLVMIAEALPKTSILSLAFNKKIADEMRERLPANCESLTLNSLGHRAWASASGRRLILDKAKNHRIIKELLDKMPNGSVRSELYENLSYLLRTMAFAKQNGWIPDGQFPSGKSLMSDYEFFASLDEEPSADEEALYRKALTISIAEAYSGTIDFDDQLYMSTLFPAAFPRYPLVLIDEAQDLSAINHAMLKKLVRGRLIAVGDECQAIYAFRGAFNNSMELLQQSFGMRKLGLSISFRCPIAVVEEARWRAPHMKYPEWAKPGAIHRPLKWAVDDLPDDAVILCRNNAPLFSCAIRLFANGRFAELVGMDIGKRLLRVLHKLGDLTMKQADVLVEIKKYRAAKLAKSRNKAAVKDECQCLRIFAQQGENLSAIIAHAEHIMQMSGTIKLMTGHKSKGLEFPNVYILDRDLLRLKEEDGQDRNLLYVMQTRAKENLTYITSAGFDGVLPAEEEEEDEPQE